MAGYIEGLLPVLSISPWATQQQSMLESSLSRPRTDQSRWVDFSMNRVRMLIHFGVIPYLVFDGDYLPSKAATEDLRAKRRAESKKLGLQLHELGKISQANLELQKAIDVTPEMARQLIEELRSIGVQYVVAPYEADAQLAYLERKGIIQGIISEDSDLLVFGAKRLLTKLDQYGDCIEINRDDFTACREVSLIGWTDVEFRRMAILSGCDYLANINKMGLKTAYRLVRKHKTIDRILRMLQFDGQFHVPVGYLEAFQKAELTFLHQRVFCPDANALTLATKLEGGIEPEDFAFVGRNVEKDVAIGVAVGDLHPMTKQPIVFGSKRKSTPKTPWTVPRSQSMDVASAMKGKSIDSFFKPKRTPLAELDPNVFTPSPSQRRLLEQHNGTWSSSPAPARPLLSRSTTASPRSASTHSPPATRNTTLGHGSNPISSLNPAKRQRLCGEPEPSNATTQSTGIVEVAKSKFFASSVSEPSPSLQRNKKSRVKKAVDVTIWSDASIEDVMAELPDLLKDGEVKRAKKLAVFVDEQACPSIELEAVAASNDEASHIIDSQQSISISGLDSSLNSTTTCFTSISSSSQIISTAFNRHVSAELAALDKKFAHQPVPNATPLAAKPAHISAAGARDPIQLSRKPSVRSKNTTPLQRLGIGALNGPQPTSRTHDQNSGKSEKPLGRALNQSNSSKPNSGKIASIEQSECTKLATKGSEDLLVPCSEDEGDDSGSPTEEPRPARIKPDLGRFAFVG